MSPSISVVLPTHNRADVLRLAIASVLAQTFSDFELLVVADGCTDETAAMVRACKDSRVRLFDLPKAPGFGYANRNVALRSARGKWIAYMSHDNLWLPDHLEILQPYLARAELEFVYTRPLYVSRRGDIFIRIINYNDPFTFRWALAANPLVTPPLSCVAHRRACLTRCGYWNENLQGGGDGDLYARILQGGTKNFAYVPIVTGLHFLANWRSESWRLRLRLAVRHREGSLPSAMHLIIPPAQTEQQAVWDLICASPQAWSEDLRRAVELQIEMDAAGAHASTLVNFVMTQFHRRVH